MTSHLITCSDCLERFIPGNWRLHGHNAAQARCEASACRERATGQCGNCVSPGAGGFIAMSGGMRLCGSHAAEHWRQGHQIRIVDGRLCRTCGGRGTALSAAAGDERARGPLDTCPACAGTGYDPELSSARQPPAVTTAGESDQLQSAAPAPATGGFPFCGQCHALYSTGDWLLHGHNPDGLACQEGSCNWRAVGVCENCVPSGESGTPAVAGLRRLCANHLRVHYLAGHRLRIVDGRLCERCGGTGREVDGHGRPSVCPRCAGFGHDGAIRPIKPGDPGLPVLPERPARYRAARVGAQARNLTEDDWLGGPARRGSGRFESRIPPREAVAVGDSAGRSGGGAPPAAPPTSPPRPPGRPRRGGRMLRRLLALAVLAGIAAVLVNSGVASDVVTEVRSRAQDFRDSRAAAPGPAATPAPAVLPQAAPPTSTQEPYIIPTQVPDAARIEMLRRVAFALVNSDRTAHGVAPVERGDNPAAQRHAQDMIAHDTLGSYWADGRKPYMVYSDEGGTSYVRTAVAGTQWTNRAWEQASCSDPGMACPVPEPSDAVHDLHRLLVDGSDDAGGRPGTTILDPSHAAVNIGVGWNGRRVVLVYYFEGGTHAFALAGPTLGDDNPLEVELFKLNPDLNVDTRIDVYYDPAPTPLTANEITVRDHVCLGGAATVRCPEPIAYVFPPEGTGSGAPPSRIGHNAQLWSDTGTSFRLRVDMGGSLTRRGVYTVVIRGVRGPSEPPVTLIELSFRVGIEDLWASLDATPTAVPAGAVVSQPAPTATPVPTATSVPEARPGTEAWVAEMRLYALELVNDDRRAYGMPPLVLGTNRAAQMHADDMIINDTYGHWWADGRKPYMVYTQTGGTSYVSENAAMSGFMDFQWIEERCGSSRVHCQAPDPQGAIADLQYRMMYDDAASNWGHRDNILGVSHGAVSFGIGWNGRRLTFVQHFEGGAVAALGPPTLDAAGNLTFQLQKLDSNIRVGASVSIYYDPPLRWVPPYENLNLRAYCTGGGVTDECSHGPVAGVIKPPEPGYTYSSLERTDVIASTWTETDTHFSFRANVGWLRQQPGTYTVIVWRDSGAGMYTEQLVALSFFVH